MAYKGQTQKDTDIATKKYVEDHGGGGSVDVDDITIGKTADDKLQVKDGGLELIKIANQGASASGKAIGFNATGDPTLIEVGGGGGEPEVYTGVLAPASNRCTILKDEITVYPNGFKSFMVQLQMTDAYAAAPQNEWRNVFKFDSGVSTEVINKLSPKSVPWVITELSNIVDNKNVDLKLKISSPYWVRNTTTEMYNYVENPTTSSNFQAKSGIGLGDLEVNTLSQDGKPLVLIASAFYY